MRIYISGPITGTKDYMERFEEAEKELTSKGYVVINPAKVNALLPADTEWKGYMGTSMAMLKLCDTIYMLKGWHNSTGAKMELKYALNYDYYVYEEGGL